VREILARSLAVQTLTPEETACLLRVEDEDLWREMGETALRVKKKVYDNRIVTFAPLYLSNFCVNNCAYCGLKNANRYVARKRLSIKEVEAQTRELAGTIGHKRLIVVYGEHPDSDIDYITQSIRTIYGVEVKTRRGTGAIRRVNVNAPPFAIRDLRRLREAGLGTYQVFQETYHHDTYKRLHPRGDIKADYAWRLYVMHRAQEAGIDDVGIGVLFGLYDWRFEVLGLLSHAIELENRFGIGPHTISFPRLEPASASRISTNSRHAVNDNDFKKLVTVIRLAVPYTGMIITARESARMREQTLNLGYTQTDASSRIDVGGYSKPAGGQEIHEQQFMLGDTRSLDELIGRFAELGHITSFCTAGYRCGRTGDKIMNLLRSGQEGRFCKLNAVLTFKEWLDDFASYQTKKHGERLIQKECLEIKERLPHFYPKLMEYYGKIDSGVRDLYF
jgi:2-iminoacetate synthase